MECKLINVICYELHTLSLRPFKFFFQQLLITNFTAAKLFHQALSERMKHKALTALYP